MEELQSLVQAPWCHVMSMLWVQMDGPFPISSPWVLTALAPYPQQHSLGLPDGIRSAAVLSDIFFFKREKGKKTGMQACSAGQEAQLTELLNLLLWR